ncbi:MAG: hypothetical protein JWN34_4497, partial [Bryobacterales bacterium]|nr:hypothetical protein [Bryobacterales bacterium]
AAAPEISGGTITNNLGPGIDVGSQAHPIISRNLIAANGAGTPGSPRPGVEVRDLARPVLKDNGIIDNAAEPVWIHSRTYAEPNFKENFFGGVPAAKAVRLLDLPAPAPTPTPKRPREGRGVRP